MPRVSSGSDATEVRTQVHSNPISSIRNASLTHPMTPRVGPAGVSAIGGRAHEHPPMGARRGHG